MRPRRSISMLALPCLLLAASGGAAGQTPWRYVHPGAKVLAGVEWRRIAPGRLGQELRRQIAEAELPAIEGLDLFDSVDRIFLSTPGNPAGGAKGQAPVLIAVEGRFEWAKLRRAIVAQGAVVSKHRGIEIFSPKKAGTGPAVLAFADPRTLLAGDLKSVQAALSSPAALEMPHLYRRAAELSARSDIWFLGMMPPGGLAEDVPPQFQMMADVTGFEFGLSLSQGMNLELNLNTKSQEAARAAAGSLRMLLGMAAMQGAKQPDLAAVVDKVRITSMQADVHLRLALDEGELERGLQSLKASMPKGLGPVEVRPVYKGDKNVSWPGVKVQPPAPARLEPPKPPEKQVIRIYGLESGTKEIQVANP